MSKWVRPYRKRDLVALVLLLLFFPTFAFFPITAKNPLESPLRIGALWWPVVTFLCLRGWYRYRRSVAPRLRTQRRTTVLKARLIPLFGKAYLFGRLDTGGVAMSTPGGASYHVYALDPKSSAARGEARSTQDQRQAARRDGATLLLLGQGGGAPVAGGGEVVLPGGLPQLVEQVEFWDEAASSERQARERGIQVEAQALAQLASAFPGWRIRTGLLMRSGGDVDALLTRPDGQVYCIDVKSHRGPPELQGGVLYFGRDAKDGVQQQLHLQARETGGQSVCWQPEAEYGVRQLDGMTFVGGGVKLLQQTLDTGEASRNRV